MAQVNFTGQISNVDATGEQVTITITQPDNSQIPTTALADSAGNFKAVSNFTAPGNYSAVANVSEDANYQAAASPVIPFTIAKSTRSLNLTITVV